jgi:shikimate kinase
MEARLTVELSSLTELVLAPGAGWAAQPGSLEALPAGTVIIWLRTDPGEALRRLHGASAVRPLLAVADPLAALTALAQQRNERYSRADFSVDVDGRTVSEIVETILTWLERSTS